ncbi:hypothetical protein LTR94_028534, partial [Friedmanniomyces endolithicus]
LLAISGDRQQGARTADTDRGTALRLSPSRSCARRQCVAKTLADRSGHRSDAPAASAQRFAHIGRPIAASAKLLWHTTGTGWRHRLDRAGRLCADHRKLCLFRAACPGDQRQSRRPDRLYRGLPLPCPSTTDCPSGRRRRCAAVPLGRYGWRRHPYFQASGTGAGGSRAALASPSHGFCDAHGAGRAPRHGVAQGRCATGGQRNPSSPGSAHQLRADAGTGKPRAAPSRSMHCFGPQRPEAV